MDVSIPETRKLGRRLILLSSLKSNYGCVSDGETGFRQHFLRDLVHKTKEVECHSENFCFKN